MSRSRRNGFIAPAGEIVSRIAQEAEEILTQRFPRLVTQ
jgi:hypothetical protein